MTNFKTDINIHAIEETLPTMLIVIATAFLTRPYVKLKKLKITDNPRWDDPKALLISVTLDEDILRHQFAELEDVLQFSSMVLAREYILLKKEATTTVN